MTEIKDTMARVVEAEPPFGITLEEMLRVTTGPPGGKGHPPRGGASPGARFWQTRARGRRPEPDPRRTA
jgi:hypothetical protein